MWFWDFTPSSRGRAKPVTKADLRKKQQAYARADEIAREARAQEDQEKEKASREMDDLLGEVF